MVNCFFNDSLGCSQVAVHISLLIFQVCSLAGYITLLARAQYGVVLGVYMNMSSVCLRPGLEIDLVSRGKIFV